MAAVRRKPTPAHMAADVALGRWLIAKLETAYQSGTLRPINPSAKSVTMEIRVKRKEASEE